MMKAEYLYNHIVHLVHAPIYVYNEQKELAAVYIDNGEQENLFDCDGEFLAFLVDQGKEELGFCGLDRNEAENAKYLVRRHHLDPRRPYCVHTVSIDVF